MGKFYIKKTELLNDMIDRYNAFMDITFCREANNMLLDNLGRTLSERRAQGRMIKCFIETYADDWEIPLKKKTITCHNNGRIDTFLTYEYIR